MFWVFFLYLFRNNLLRLSNSLIFTNYKWQPSNKTTTSHRLQTLNESFLTLIFLTKGKLFKNVCPYHILSARKSS